MASATPRLHGLQDRVDARLKAMRDQDVVRRIWQCDHTVWKPDPTEITSPGRLGWLTVIEPMLEEADAFDRFADEVAADGFQMAVLLGMGGSSLAPEVFQRTYGTRAGRLDLRVLDTTDPKEVLALARAIDLKRALFIVASKSGSTIETLSHLAFFWARVPDGRSFIAITDAGTPLEALARERGFRRVFLNPPQVGGRYSALTYFGLVPAALIGVDLGRLLGRAREMLLACRDGGPGDENPGAGLGAVMGEAALAGRDKLTVLADTPLIPFGSWLEQLIAESTGKDGTGIVPVDREPLGDASVYGEDRLVVYLRQTGEYDASLGALREAGHPILEIAVPTAYDLGAEIYRWEVATAVACHILGVNAFDQPNVEDAKIRAKAQIASYQESGKLESGEFVLLQNAKSALEEFLKASNDGDYIAIMGFLPRSNEMIAALQDLRVAIREMTKRAVTLGFGPRFLHSTGQLHKGGANNGLFLQITADPLEDVEIPTQGYVPEKGMSLGTLELAQALGDYEALKANGRRVLRIHLSKPDEIRGIKNLIEK